MTKGPFAIERRTRTVSPEMRPSEHNRLIVSGSFELRKRIVYAPFPTSESFETGVSSSLLLSGTALPPGHVDGRPDWAERLSIALSEMRCSISHACLCDSRFAFLLCVNCF
jgi:hypothetical protein